MPDNSSSPTHLHNLAIQAALSANWEEALKLNQELNKAEPQNVDVLNRLARTHFELGNLKDSKKFYEEALKIDPYNQIAAKFLKRIEVSAKKGSNGATRTHTHFVVDSFIEEPGKTKLVTLIKLAEPQKLSMLSSGEPVLLVAKNRGIVVTDMDNRYLGIMPDDVGHRLLKLIRGGNKYQGCIKTIKTNSLSVLVREIHRAARFRNQPSFLENLNGTLAYSSDHIIVSDDSDDSSADEVEEEVN